MYDALVGWSGSSEQKEIRERFFRSANEAAFLFSDKSDISRILKDLNDDAQMVIGFKEKSSDYSQSPDTFKELFDQEQEILTRRFPQGLEALKIAMKPYLDFPK